VADDKATTSANPDISDSLELVDTEETVVKAIDKRRRNVQLTEHNK